MMKRLLVLAAALVLFTAACGDDGDDATPTDDSDTEVPAPDGDGAPDDDDAPGASAEVVADPDLAFDPETVEISAGETVVWQNSGGIPHTVTSTAGDLDFDESLSDGSTVSITFDDAGTYEYRCDIHPVMTGQVVVS
jgi:plastocyanin